MIGKPSDFIQIKYRIKSITGVFVVAGIIFIGLGTIMKNDDLTSWGTRFLILGIASWVYHIDKFRKIQESRRSNLKTHPYTMPRGRSSKIPFSKKYRKLLKKLKTYTKMVWR